MRLPSLIRLVVFIVIGAVPVAGQVQAQRLNIDAFLQQWDTDHDGTLSVDEIKKAALAPALLCFIVALSASPFKSKSRLEAENAALRHQLMVLRRKVHGRVGLTNNDRLFSGDARGGRAMVADEPQGKAHQDRREGGEPWPLRGVPVGRGRSVAAVPCAESRESAL